MTAKAGRIKGRKVTVDFTCKWNAYNGWFQLYILNFDLRKIEKRNPSQVFFRIFSWVRFCREDWV
jgi:hypothetical protein